MSTGPLQAALHDTLVDALQPVALEIENESHRHSGSNPESHFKVTVVAEAFEGQALVKRHRTVNALAKDQLAAGLHALSIHAYTPAQWEARGGAIPKSPPCMGGSKSS
ncbi:MAG: BolA family protein [Myxococcota bacterium]